MFETILSLDGITDEMKRELKAVETSIQEKDTAIESLTSQFNDAKSSRDAYKAGNALVKQALGLDKINDESIKEKMEALTNKNKAAQQIQELTQKLSTKDREINEIKTGFEAKYTQMSIDNALNNAIGAVSGRLKDDPLIRSAFKDILSRSIGKVGDKIVPYTLVGDQKVPVVVNGENQSIESYVATTLDSESFVSFRKPNIKTSAGNTGGGVGGSNTITRKDFDALPPFKQAEAAQKMTIKD